ncbi:class I SAM-dependent methyltransferase [Kribbella sp. CWNU-51]
MSVALAEASPLDCGTACIGASVMRAGGRPVGIDNSAEQLATAEALQQEFGLVFPLIHGNAEQVPLPDNSSTWRSVSTAPAVGVTRRCGFQKPRGCSGPAAS